MPITSRGIPPAINVRDFGATGNGTTNDQTAFTAAITAAVASGKPIQISPGTYGLTSPIALKDGVTFLGTGRGRATIKALSGFSGAALLLGSSGDTVSDFAIEGVTLDGGYTTTSAATHGIQITNGSSPRVHRCGFTNFGGSAVLFQGLSGGGTPDAEVLGCFIDGTGLADGTTGHAISIKDASHRALVMGNNLTNVKGGMGICIGVSAAATSPMDCRVIGNVIRMVQSTTGFEAIGVGNVSRRIVVANNNIFDSWDNGISMSGESSVISGNLIDGALDHGIAAVGKYHAITGNTVKNAGKETAIVGRAGFGQDFGGVATDDGQYVTISGNTIVDDQGSPTMAYAIKLNSSDGYHRIGPNTMVGYTKDTFFGLGSFDVVYGLDGVLIVTTLAANGAVALNANRGGYQRIQLQANATSATLTGGFIGQRLVVSWNQDATGGRTYVWPANIVWAGGVAPTASTVANARDRVTLTYDGTNWNEESRAVGVS
jgi:hypothetical protein